ncbi:MAG TPA: TonB-dependent receptor [Gammaproteobacteria bacterium]|nr:TonB-dependent receptor [Gammaproteobacteria bacterium]
MIRKCPARRALASAVAQACLGAGAQLALGVPALAQAPPAADGRAPGDVEEIIVETPRAEPYRVEDSSLTKLVGPLRDVPQSIVTIPRELLDDRAAITLNDALRTVPGITLGAGEFSWQGNNPSIRGFNSRNDMFLDGMRDFGSYPRDPFNVQTVEVLQGPSSTIFGRGSTGGVINQASKRPTLEPLVALSINGGSDDTHRVTADFDRPLAAIGDGAALRVNAMAHESEVAGRDVAQSERWGVAPSLSLGLDGPRRLTLSYLHQSTDDVPDYGLPWFAGAPAPVPRGNFYGFESDYLNTDADIFTADMVVDGGGNRALHGQLRDARYSRESRLTEPLIAAAVPTATPPANVTVTRNVFTGSSEETMTQGQGDLTLRFDKHTVVTGIELAHETSAPSFGFGVGVPGTNLVSPNPHEPFTATSTAPRLIADTSADSAAAYALDTLKLGPQWQLSLGLRWDRFDVDYRATRFALDGSVTGNEAISRTDDELSYRVGVVYKPREHGSVYLAGGTSFNPSAETLSFITSGRALGLGNAFLAPEENASIELGTKWDLVTDAFSVNAALFRIEKSNARVPDPNNVGFNMLAGDHRVDGWAVTIVGAVGDAWQLSSGYTHLDSQVIETAAGAAPVGSPLIGAPDDSFSAWAAYEISARFEVGFGARYLSGQIAQNVPPIKRVDDYWAFDAMGKYHVSDSLTLKLNLTNLGDEYYLDQLHPFHVVPGPGFTAMFAVNLVY